ncbi:MAG: sigma-70 family RNA polymerase sigma factor [candidate division KSB1 bacterium]|nr:sigma-70 family RNA polymerase sigma factor [candidate division KSB1 bacterium]
MDLIEAIQAGSLQAESELLLHFRQRIIHKVRFSLGLSNKDWEDVVSEVQLALLSSLRHGRFDVSKGVPLGSYVYAITMNKIRDYFKQHKKEQTVIADPGSENDMVVEEEDSLEHQELKTFLRGGLARLKLKYREVLYLRYFKEYSITQISQEIKLPPRRVSERIHYALKLLREQCKKEDFFSIFEWFLLICIQWIA